jgi:hypothetical protein
MDQSARSLFERLRSPEGEDLVLKDNVFIEKLPARPTRFELVTSAFGGQKTAPSLAVA